MSDAVAKRPSINRRDHLARDTCRLILDHDLRMEAAPYVIFIAFSRACSRLLSAREAVGPTLVAK